MLADNLTQVTEYTELLRKIQTLLMAEPRVLTDVHKLMLSANRKAVEIGLVKPYAAKSLKKLKAYA